MSADTVDSFLHTLQQFHLLSPSQISDLTSQLPGPQATLDELGRILLQRGWLTPYQLDQLRKKNPDLVLGPYVLLEFLGSGGMGRVYKAKHMRLGRLTALKIIRPDQMSGQALQRFLREAKAAACLSHPNVVTIYDADEHEGVHFLAMEYVEGADLKQVVKSRGALSVAEACEYARQAALGLQHAFEQGLVHRDIKPSNLMAAKSTSSAPVIKILDFGLARWDAEEDDENQITISGQVLGTPDFVAPEQIEDSRHADIRADIYSLGATLFWLLCGRPPFPGSSSKKLAARLAREAPPLRSLMAQAPLELEQVIQRMMMRDPAERYQTPAEVVAALKPFLGAPSGDPASSRTPATVPDSPRAASPPPPAAARDRDPARVAGSVPVAVLADEAGSRRVARRPGPLLAALVALLIVAAIAIFWVVNRDRGHQGLIASPGGDIKQEGDGKPARPEKEFINSIGMKLVRIPAGEFDRGSHESEEGHQPTEGPVHHVTLTKAFFMGTHEVTQGQFFQVMKKNPSWFSPQGKGKAQVANRTAEEIASLPVESVTWDEAVEFCRLLSERPNEKAAGRVYRLPTDAEWEYACRAGTRTPYFFGMKLSAGQAVFGTEAPVPQPVGTCRPNAFGLHDMHGNVWEWCQDVMGPYPREPQIDPRGLDGPKDRVIRGGGFYYQAPDCRSARRAGFPPHTRLQYHGFRVVCDLAPVE